MLETTASTRADCDRRSIYVEVLSRRQAERPSLTTAAIPAMAIVVACPPAVGSNQPRTNHAADGSAGEGPACRCAPGPPAGIALRLGATLPAALGLRPVMAQMGFCGSGGDGQPANRQDEQRQAEHDKPDSGHLHCNGLSGDAAGSGFAKLLHPARLERRQAAPHCQLRRMKQSRAQSLDIHLNKCGPCN